MFLVVAAIVGSQTPLLGQESELTAEETTPPPPESPPEIPAEEPTGITITDDMVAVAPVDDHADLEFMNRKITRFRAEIMGLPPSSRVADAGNRIQERVKAGAIDRVGTLRVGDSIFVLVNDRPVLVITKGDLDQVAGQTLEERAMAAAGNLEKALAEVTELSRPRELAISLVASVIATALYVLLLWVLRKLRQAIERRFVKATGTKLQKSVAGRIATAREQRRRIIDLSRRLVSLLFVAVALVITYLWLTFVLRRFPFTRPWGEALGDFLLATAAWMGNGIVAAIPGLFIVVVIFVLTRTASKIVDMVFAAVEAGRIDVPGIYPETAGVTRRLVIAALWLLAIVLAYPHIPGSNSMAFKGLSVFVGAVLSLGSTGVVNQAMSGLMLTYSRALRVDDFVRVGDVEGTVLDVGILSTKIRTIAREEVTVPNAVVISKETINFTRFSDEGVAINTTVTIGYDTPWRQVQALLVEAAERTPGLRDEPAPFVLQTGLSDFYPEYRLMAVIDQPETRGRVLSTLHANIQDLFNEYGIQIMSPHYREDPEEPLLVPPDRRNPPPAPPETAGS
ncbi:MAG: mechanosensitive ion channel [Acidobacteria bacterium]|nr:MAG: mechanosensitive ion channel [Acidobacteriota bacterium]